MDSIRRALSTFTLRGSPPPLVIPQDPDMVDEMVCAAIIANDTRQLAALADSPKFNVNLQFGRARRTFLHVAVGVSAVDCALLLLKRGADPNLGDAGGNTSLHLAARNGLKKVMKVLLEHKADLTAANSDGFTVTHWLASNGRLELMNYLLDLKVPMEVTDTQGQTPLHVAAMNGHREIVQLLLDAHVDVDKKDRNGRTASFFAARYGQTDCLRLLLTRGAVPVPDSAGVSPLHLTVRGGFRDCVHLLVKRDPSRCLDTVLQIVSQPGMEDDKALPVLKYVAEEGGGALRPMVMSKLAAFIANEGQQLLSLHSDVDAVSSNFIRMVKLFAELLHAFVSWPGIDQYIGIVGRDDDNPSPLPKSTSNSSFSTLSSPSATSGLSTSAGGASSSSSFAAGNPSSNTTSSLPRRNSNTSGLRFGFGHARTSSATSSNATTPSNNSSNNNEGSSSSNNNNNPMGSTSNSVLAPMLAVSTSSSSGTSPTAPGPVSSLAAPSTPTRNNEEQPIARSGSISIPSPSMVILGATDDASHSHGGAVLLESLWTALEEWLALLAQQTAGTSGTSPSVGLSVAPAVLVTPEPGIAPSSVATGPDSPATGTDAPAETDAPSALSSRAAEKRKSRLAEDTERSVPALALSTTSSSPPQSSTDHAPSDLMRLYADRLACIIHGFYLCCSRKSSALPPRFLQFVYRHCATLRRFVERNPIIIFKHFHFLLDHSLLMDRFIDVVRAQPFALRREWFFENLTSDSHVDDSMFLDESKVMVVERENLFQASCGALSKKSADELRNPFGIRFRGEAGVGAGVRREWFDSLSHEILDPNYALFVPSEDGCTFQPNPNSHINPDHLSYFRFAGRVIGMALFHRQLLDVYFTRSFYKHILGIPISYADVESIDQGYYKSLQWVLDNQIEGSELDLVFAIEVDNFGKVDLIELKPGGAHIAVTDENKAEYVQLATQLKMTCAIGPQICSFLDGFHEFVPASLVAIFNEYELELLISGSKEIDIADWEEHTAYNGFEKTDSVIKWFWEMVQQFPKDQRIMLLQFVTGSSRVPLGGFANLMGVSGKEAFTISKLDDSVERLPSASTCFNLLKMPAYSSAAMVVERFQMALAGGSKQFDFA
ncbi:HECT and ankyrin repeat domain-containing protein [Capsaspora owczarzaki ATCC 30864]|uniref:E3 ubiquitin-protein ligase HACE1 n=1 Tax=Capsaspora owczarzaki (strain ATCC 30864) TaxID=595528 RepID=A0A0D2WU29_CAPO3|nr:HECT and ankyrin repeat domain-containing protein [Capsaspora owczarzaki ATCC 30864]KJE95313.1 HECT and ankyrin repeat domain-containing protein [Capsaspora owczarzaki ATCC 30864]|eukprot:XP_004346447.2 HECT and ankyrin repeat domain-containing protein [Capsaspora owczarzaki ATCC 30864]